MNHVYRLCWNRSTAQWVPASELAHNAGPLHSSSSRLSMIGRRALMLSALAASLGMTGLAHAGNGPTGGQITAGSGQIQQVGTTTTIKQNSQTLSLNWQSFNVASNETVNFEQPGANSIAVNRILSSTASDIFGHLNANGQVWLINPNGILFGQSAQVNVGGLVASTLDLDDNTLGFSNRSFSGSGKGSVINQGSITANGGYVALLGNQVSNQGVIGAQLGTVALGGGSAMTLTFNGNQLVHLQVDKSTLNNLAENRQLIVANGGQVIMTAGAKNALLASVVNNTGVIQAQSVSNHNGTITLLGGMAAGTVNVGGTLDASAPNGGNGGAIETSAEHFNLASDAKITAAAPHGMAGQWLVDPIDLNIDAAAATTIETSLNGGTSVTETTTATGASGPGTQGPGTAGDINVLAPITWTNAAANFTLSAYNAININAAITGAGGLSLSATGSSINVNAAVSAGTGVTMNTAAAGININAAVTSAATITAHAIGGNLIIGTGGSVAGDTGVTLGTSGNFANQVGAGAVASSGGRWLIYSTNPTLDTDGGLTPNFIQYNAPYLTAPAAAGNGFLYSLAPTVNVTGLTGNVTKIYDGTTAASLTGANIVSTGLVNGDQIATATGTYANANAGTNISVTSTNSVAAYTFTDTTGTIPVYGYKLTGTGTAAIGTISPKQLTASIIGSPTKVYDGTTTATLSSANYSLSGFVTGQGATVNQPSSVGYAAADAGNELITANFSAENFTANSGTLFANYILPTTGSGPGVITPAPLLIRGLQTSNKVYDGTTTDPLNASGANLYGIIGPDTGLVTLDTSGGTGNFASPNVGNNLAVTIGGFSLTGSKASDYMLIEPTGLTANITPLALSVSGVMATNKVYDGGVVDPLNLSGATLNGVIAGDSITLSTAGATGNFGQSDVGNNLAVTASGFSLTGAGAGNYTIAQPAGLTANITPAPLMISFAGNPTKIYDGTTAATLTSGDFTVTGFIGTQSAVVSQSPAVYASQNANPSVAVTASLEPSDFTPANGTSLSNYSFPATVSGTGAINPAPLVASIIGNPTKVYDGTTTASLTTGNFALSGFVGSDNISVSTVPTGNVYNNPNAGVQGVTSGTVTTGDYTAASGTLLSNYVLPTVFTGFGTITPIQVGVSLNAAIANQTKIYDGTTSLTLQSSDFTLTGFVDGDTAVVNGPIAGQYASPNVGTQPISATLNRADFTFSPTTPQGDYTFPVLALGTGTITPAPLTVQIINNPTKTYDGTTTASLTSGNFQVLGFVPGEGGTINPTTAFNYTTANASATSGTDTVSGSLTTNNYVTNPGTLLSNYTIVTTAQGPGTINQAPLFVTGVYATNKVYDTTAADTLNIGAAALAGLVSSDVGNVGLTTSTTGTFPQSNVGTGLSVTASGFSISGSASSNYILQPITGLTANITPKGLTVSGILATDKTYDATTTDALNTTNGALVGILGSDNVTLSSGSAMGQFSTSNVGNGLSVSTSGFAIGGTSAGNYFVMQPGGLTANITPALLTATITGNPTKAYDGSNSATLTAADYTLTGFFGGQGASIPQSATANYVTPNAGTNVEVGSTLVTSDFLANAGTNLANYILPTTGDGTGTISPKILNLSGTRVYDTTTNANGNLFGTLTGLNGDTLTVSGVGTTSSKNVGSYTGGNFTLASLDLVANGSAIATNYTLVGGTDIFTITPATINVIDGVAQGRVYNNTTVATVNGAMLSGVLGSDNVTITNPTVGTFNNKNVGLRGVTTNVGVTGTDASNYILVQQTGLSATISPLAITIDATGNNKVYDGTTTATVGLMLDGSTPLAPGDTLTYTNTSAVFASANVGSNVGVNVAGIKANGTDSGDYTYNATATTTANITPRPIQLNSTRIYDGATDADASLFTTGGTLTGVLGQTLTLTGSGVLNGKDVGTQGFQSLGSLALGNGTGLASNYTLSPNGNLTPYPADSVIITPIVFNLSGFRDYNAGTDAAGNLFGTLTGLNGDTFTVSGAGVTSSKNVGTYTNTGPTNLLSLGTLGLVPGGTANASDYTLIGGTDTFIINPLQISVALAANGKTYDGTTAATGTLSSSGVLAGDQVNFASNPATFATPNAGTGILVTATNITDSGTDAGNYVLLNTTATDTADITPKLILLNSTRPYDGTTGADASLFTTGGAIATGIGGQTLTLSGSGVLVSKNASTTPEDFQGLGTLALGNGGSGGLSSNYTLGTGAGDSVLVTPLNITVTASAQNKVYDGTDAVNVALTGNGVIAGDNISFADGSAAFASPNAANGVLVNVTGITDSGTDASNYNLLTANTTTTANITPRPLVLQSTRVYDGTTSADASLFTTGGTIAGIAGQTLTLTGSGVLTTKNVGSERPFQGLGTLALGNSSGLASNYTLSPIADDWVTITPLAITVAAAGSNKTYDGNTGATVGLSSSGILPGDQLSFTDTAANFGTPNAGTNIPIAVTGISGSGADAGNYTFNNAAMTAANITPAIINLIGTRVYDATTDADASLFGNNGVVTGINGETLDLSGSGVLVSKNVNPAQPFSSFGSLALNNGSGLASNYTLIGGIDQVAITPATLTVVGTQTTNRAYDGTRNDALSGSMLSGLLGSDNVALGNDTLGIFNNKNVGNGKSITTSMTIDGSDASNYILVQPTGLTANVTPLPITVNAKGTNRPFNGTSGDKVTLSSNGVLPGDQVGFANTSSNFTSPNPGNNKTIDVDGITTTGEDASNYVVIDPDTTAIANVTNIGTTALGVNSSWLAQIQSVLNDPRKIATPYGVAEADTVGVFTGNQKLRHRSVERNRIRTDFHSGLPLKVLDGGVRLPTDASP